MFYFEVLWEVQQKVEARLYNCGPKRPQYAQSAQLAPTVCSPFPAKSCLHHSSGEYIMFSHISSVYITSFLCCLFPCSLFGLPCPAGNPPASSPPTLLFPKVFFNSRLLIAWIKRWIVLFCLFLQHSHTHIHT